MNANVLDANTGYLIETFLQLDSGEISRNIWIITTDILPYGGTCEMEDMEERGKNISCKHRRYIIQNY